MVRKIKTKQNTIPPPGSNPTPPIPPPSQDAHSPTIENGKQNGTMESTWAHWMVTDETELLEFLQDILEGGDGVNFKTVTWTAAAKVVDKNQTKGASKNTIACKNKFTGVCLFPFILLTNDILQLKETYFIVDALKQVSGFKWHEENDAGINSHTLPVWNAYVEVCALSIISLTIISTQRYCKRTSIHFLTFPLLSSIILHFPLLYHTHSCSYVHSPTLCTITRCQTLEVDDSWTYYCCRHPTPPLHSYLWSFGQASDTLGQVHMTLRHPPPSRGCPYMGGLVLGSLVLHFSVYHCRLT
jgi:hypothetical protein